MFEPIQRTKCGQGIVVLVIFISVFILCVIGLFSFEVNRAELAREQLRSSCEAASLAAAATLASQDNLDPMTAHTQAMATGLNSFNQNKVIGKPLNAILTAVNPNYPGPNNSSLYIEFLDPNNNYAKVNLGDPAGKIVRVTASFGLEPAFGKFVGIPDATLTAVESAGVPDLDVILCFDVSGSIDDQTPVTFIRRQWTGTAATGRILYNIPPTQAGSPVQPSAQGKIYDILGPPATGTRVNGLYPQYLSSSNQSDVRWPLNFSEKTGAPGAARGLRGATNSGSPPGNYPPPASGTGNAYTYTDLVVNIDGRNTFAGLTTADGYNFPDVGTLAEAARGNLENSAVFSASKADRGGLPPSVIPRAGYQAKYFSLAAQQMRPIKDAQAASAEFYTIMNTNTNGHFGLIAFSDNAGTSADGGYNASNVDSYYSQAGTGTFPIPNVGLNPAQGATNYTTIQNKLPLCIATTATNIGDAVYKAVQQCQSSSRPGSKKAIVLFTDGQPTAGNPLDPNPWTNARQAAVAAKNAGIPIYTIGLAQNPEIIPGETAILNDTNPDPSTGGMAAIAGNGGKFFLVTDVSDLRLTFENIARQLVQLVR